MASEKIEACGTRAIHALGPAGRILVPIVFGNLLDRECTSSKTQRLDIQTQLMPILVFHHPTTFVKGNHEPNVAIGQRLNL